MGITPDRQSGPREEEELQLTDEGVDPSVVGALVNKGGELLGKDSTGIFNLRSGSGLTAGSHRPLDQLVHNIAESSFTEYLYTGNRVDSMTVWETAAKLKKIREELYTYTGNKVTTIVTRQYDAAGVVIVGETYTEVLAYTGGRVDTSTGVLT